MNLTRQTDYAIRILMYCCSRGQLTPVNTIASFYRLPEPFLLKIVQILNKAGFIESVRGRNGGIRLAKSADMISLGAVIRATEDRFTLAECFETDASLCPLVTTCRLSQALREALQAFLHVLDQYTLVDLTDKQSNLNILVKLDMLASNPL